MRVEVVAGSRDQQLLVELDLAEGATVWDAVQASGIQDQLPDLTIDRQRLGVFGRLCSPDRVLQPGERVEIYRPLHADPKDIRRELAKIERAKRNSVV